MPGLFDTPGKNAVRNRWNTPVLEYIYDKFGFKFRYLGLPGVEIIDIKLWKRMIEEVIAFELESEDPRHKYDKRRNLTKLKENLESLDIPYKVYCGPMEYVIVMGSDLDGAPYKQDKLINLYNLDFCDEITSMVSTPKGDERLRFEFIRQILSDQHECFRQNPEQKYFTIFLTARNQTNSTVLNRFLLQDIQNLGLSTASYIKKANGENRIPGDPERLVGTHGWALKAFVFDTIIHSYFPGHNISCILLPMVKYEGDKTKEGIPSPMMHWMILCKFEDRKTLPKPKIYPQKFLYRCSLMANEDGINLSPEAGEIIKSETDPLKYMEQHGASFFS